MGNMIFANFLILTNLELFAKKCLRKKYQDKRVTVFIFIIGVSLLSFMNYPNEKILGFAIMTIFYIFYVFTLFQGELYKKILMLLLFSIVVSFSEIVTANLMNKLFELNLDKINTSLYSFALLFSNILTFIILYFFSNILKNISTVNYSRLMWLSFVLPFTTIILLLNIPDYFETFRSNNALFIIMIGLLISNVFFLYTLLKETQRKLLDKEMEKVKSENSLLQFQYNTSFVFLHDTIRELIKLDNLIEAQEYVKVREKILSLNKSLIKYFNIINTNSSMISALLNHNIQTILDNNISVHTVIEFNDFSFLTLNDQQNLFSELLYIAIKSCTDNCLGNPNIIIKTKKVHNNGIIKVSFSCEDRNNINTDKIKQLVEKYNGVLIFNFDHQEKFNYANILISFHLISDN